MSPKTEEVLQSYNDILAQLSELNSSLSEKILISGREIAKAFVPVIANVHFSEFKKNLQEKNYSKVYESPVFKAIQSLCEEDNRVILKEGTIVVRARIIKDVSDIYSSKDGIHFDGEVLRGYDWFNSKEPPVGVSTEGRANSRFSSYFYCADLGQTAASEIKANIGDYISLAAFDIKRDFKLIHFVEKELSDITSAGECYRNIIAKYFSTPVNDLKDYYLTQFISDEIRKYGVDGICYKSHFTDRDNYVLFNCSMNTIQFRQSKIIQLHSQSLNYIDFSAGKMISTKAIDDPTSQEIENEKLYIYGMMQAYQAEMTPSETLTTEKD